MLKSPLLRFFFLTFFCCQVYADNNKQFSGWTHIELGAGNYGQDGHTKTALRKTVFKKFDYISYWPNYIDWRPESEEQSYDPQQQYAVLFSTLDKLIARSGPMGVFHVNDLVEEYADFAAEKLKEYAEQNGYSSVIIDVVAGAYTKIRPKETLKEFQRNFYDSVHLKNPELSFYNYGLSGYTLYSSKESRQRARNTLQKLAQLGNKGLYFFVINPNNYYIPKEEQDEFIDKNIFYQKTDKWLPVPYHFPHNATIPVNFSQVFFIPADPDNALDVDTENSTCPPRLGWWHSLWNRL